MTEMREPGEPFDGSSLLPVWERLRAAEESLARAERRFHASTVLTERRVDEAHRAGVRAYITASALIGRARENQHLLERTMTVPDVGVFPHATTNLIRPAFEAALTALWILDGSNTNERRLRGLRCAQEDHRQSNAWADEVLSSRFFEVEHIEERRARQAVIAQRFRNDAKDLGIRWERVNQKVNLRDVIGDLTVLGSEPDLVVFLRALWRRMSGVQHGLSYASLLGTEKRQEVKIPGGVQVILVTADDALLTDCRVSALMQLWAMERFVHRTTAPIR